MEPINWLAVILGLAAGLLLAMVWYGLLVKADGDNASLESRRSGDWWMAALVLLIGSAMLGHNFARIGADTLEAKPWLYFMQAGGIALAFVVPAVWLTSLRAGLTRRARLAECGYWLAAYLAIGAVFWALG